MYIYIYIYIYNTVADLGGGRTRRTPSLKFAKKTFKKKVSFKKKF